MFYCIYFEKKGGKCFTSLLTKTCVFAKSKEICPLFWGEGQKPLAIPLLIRALLSNIYTVTKDYSEWMGIPVKLLHQIVAHDLWYKFITWENCKMYHNFVILIMF